MLQDEKIDDDVVAAPSISIINNHDGMLAARYGTQPFFFSVSAPPPLATPPPWPNQDGGD